MRVLPKDLLRNAYAVHCIPDNPDFNKDDDLAVGLKFLIKELEIKSEYIEEADELLKLLESNRPGGRGELKLINAVLLLYAWELVSDCAQFSLMSQRAKKAQNKNKYASKKVSEELIRYQATSLQCIDTAIELYLG